MNIDTHVYVSNDFLPLVGSVSVREQDALEMCADEPRTNSRMAAYLTLNKAMSGVVVALAPIKPWETP